MSIQRIGVSSLVFDLFGAAVLKCDAGRALENLQGRRRVTRTPTLDGNAAVYDAGASVADRSIVVTTDLIHLDWLKRIVTVYSLVLVVIADGAFTAVPNRYWTQNSRACAEFLLLEQKD